MAGKIQKSKFSGIRYRESDTRKNGIRKDRYFFLRYKRNGKDIEEGFGWESEGFTESAAYEELCLIKQNIKTGSGHFSLKEKREKEQAERDATAAKNITINAFFEEYFIPYHLNNKTEKTKDNQIKLYEKHIKNELGHKYLNDVTRFDIEKIKAEMVQKNYAAATINYIIGIIKSIFNRAAAFDKFDKKNPAELVESVIKDNKRTRWLTKEEAEKLLFALKTMKLTDKKAFAYDYYEKFKTSQLYEMALISLFCGLRAKELRFLTVSDVDFNTGQIFIRDPKNKESRYVPMPQLIFTLLKQRIDNILGLEPNDYLFRANNGEQLPEISDQFYRIVARLGFNDNIVDDRQKVVFHTLRHTYASWLIQSGVPKYVVKKLLGHKKDEMTDRYAHLAPDNFNQAAQIIDNSYMLAIPSTSGS
ncbi:MAG: site-specific integrase [Alphaproteobacteria bacterium]|nr:site-specific integrase [Alphaproteobacteria bacterium]